MSTDLALPFQIPLPLACDTLAPLSAALNAATHEERVSWLRGLGTFQIRKLYRLAQGSPLFADELAPEPGTEYIGEGKNALPLPVLSDFQKRFARVGGQIAGYNKTGKLATTFAGPGHFTVTNSPDVPGEVWIDYRTVAQERYPTFPALSSSDQGFWPKVVYGGMVDICRRVSQHVVVGDSFVNGKPKHVPFALVFHPIP